MTVDRTEARTELLKAAGLSKSSIAAIFAVETARAHGSPHALQHIHLPQRVRERSGKITEFYGRNFVCASEILAVLIADGVCKEGSSATAIGDACGRLGLCLPSFVVRKRYYDLSMVGKTEGERDERQQKLDSLTRISRRAAAGLLKIQNEEASN